MDAGLAAVEDTPRSVTILGSTGSVGCNTLDLIERNRDTYAVEALTANSSAELLAAQARRVEAKLAVVADESCYAALKEALAGSGIEAAAGPQAISDAAARPVDWVMAAIVGLANKETLVCAGSLMTQEITRHGARLLPVDSEHNAIYQVLETDRPTAVERIILTASGGPFLGYSQEEMSAVTPAQAVAHPNWDMGAKISVDSATMMNKGLELIEARYLFGTPEERIEILVHPQSIVHSMVAYVDGSVLAQLGQPDMRTPIAYTLAWPHRMAAPVAQLDLAAIGQLTFEAPDMERFPAMSVARQALKAGGSAPAVMNAANEIAVAAFLKGRIGFLDIVRLVEQTLEALQPTTVDSIEAVIEIDLAARAICSQLLDKVATGR